MQLIEDRMVCVSAGPNAVSRYRREAVATSRRSLGLVQVIPQLVLGRFGVLVLGWRRSGCHASAQTIMLERLVYRYRLLLVTFRLAVVAVEWWHQPVLNLWRNDGGDLGIRLCGGIDGFRSAFLHGPVVREEDGKGHRQHDRDDHGQDVRSVGHGVILEVLGWVDHQPGAALAQTVVVVVICSSSSGKICGKRPLATVLVHAGVMTVAVSQELDGGPSHQVGRRADCCAVIALCQAILPTDDDVHFWHIVRKDVAQQVCPFECRMQQPTDFGRIRGGIMMMIQRREERRE
mmetsp:Transcript_10418/g.29709  ORF Transcript_10418/g.29709 Transcript_10418/m.29709 type:complete len:290 (-) Transcript_10418:1301-2170(-)